MAFAPRFRMGPPLGASPPMRMTASWCDRHGRPNTSSRRATSRPMASSPRYRRGVDEKRAKDTPIAPIEQAWRCARDRQGQVAARRPSAALDRCSAQRLCEYQVGTRRCRRPVEQGDALAKTALTPIAPYKSMGGEPTNRGRAGNSRNSAGDRAFGVTRTASCVLGRRGIGGVALEQDVAAETMEVGLHGTPPCLFGDRQSPVDQR